MRRVVRKKTSYSSLILLLILGTVSIITVLQDSYSLKEDENVKIDENIKEYETYNILEIPEYNYENYVVINENNPNFSGEEKNNVNSFEKYSELDTLGRCGTAYANIGKDLMPTTERESIGSIKPSGWKTVKYDNISGKYLYNRCHLIGFQLTGENANPKNLITCTRQMNTIGMIKFENRVANYVKETNNHVLYRVTPIYDSDNLIAKGVEIEAYSVEDKGKGIKFNVFVYNVQDGIEIDYKTGDSKLKEE